MKSLFVVLSLMIIAPASVAQSSDYLAERCGQEIGNLEFPVAEACEQYLINGDGSPGVLTWIGLRFSKDKKFEDARIVFEQAAGLGGLRAQMELAYLHMQQKAGFQRDYSFISARLLRIVQSPKVGFDCPLADYLDADAKAMAAGVRKVSTVPQSFGRICPMSMSGYTTRQEAQALRLKILASGAFGNHDSNSIKAVYDQYPELEIEGLGLYVLTGQDALHPMEPNPALAQKILAWDVQRFDRISDRLLLAEALLSGGPDERRLIDAQESLEPVLEIDRNNQDTRKDVDYAHLLMAQIVVELSGVDEALPYLIVIARDNYHTSKKSMLSHLVGQANTALGKWYLTGYKGLVVDESMARQYFEKAAKYLDIEGAFLASRMAIKGVGGPEDYEKAVEYTFFAAQSGHPQAAFVAATMILRDGVRLNGKTVQDMQNMALDFTVLAHLQGVPNAQRMLEAIEKQFGKPAVDAAIARVQQYLSQR